MIGREHFTVSGTLHKCLNHLRIHVWDALAMLPHTTRGTQVIHHELTRPARTCHPQALSTHKLPSLASPLFTHTLQPQDPSTHNPQTIDVKSHQITIFMLYLIYCHIITYHQFNMLLKFECFLVPLLTKVAESYQNV